MSAAIVARHVLEVLVLTSVNGQPAEAADVLASANDVVVLHAAVRTKAPGRRCVLFTDAPKPRTRCRVVAPPSDVDVVWSKIEPTRPWYDNLAKGAFSPATITYAQRDWDVDGWRVVADVSPQLRRGLPVGGTMRFSVRVVLKDGTERAAKAPVGPYVGGVGRAKDARRVTLRAGDDYLGFLSELGGVPYVFGSATIGREVHQAERAVGVDCADLMIYGLRRMGHDLPYISSRTMGPYSRSVVDRVRTLRGDTYLDGEGSSVVVGPSGVQPGDWIIFEGHVGAFHTDRGTPGVLDRDDLIVHTAWAEVAIQSLGESGWGERPFEVRRAKALAR